jgi:hypothetical protein
MQNAHGCYLIGRVGKKKKGLLQLASCCSVGEMITENQRNKELRLHWMTLVERKELKVVALHLWWRGKRSRAKEREREDWGCDCWSE